MLNVECLMLNDLPVGQILPVVPEVPRFARDELLDYPSEARDLRKHRQDSKI